MKVRIGYGLGTAAGGGGRQHFLDLVDGLERHRFDSLWLSERITGVAPGPLVGLALAAGRTERLKLGTSVLVLPGRNPAVLAKELATLDVLSGGRLLPAFGLGVVEPHEQQAFGVRREERAPWFDEALPLIRRLWTDDEVDHAGRRFTYTGLSVRPKPVQQPPDVWLGGRVPSELRRTGRLGDGWLPSFCTPDEAAAGRKIVEEAADRAGRWIDPEHFGALVVYTHGPLPDRLTRALAARRPDIDPGELVMSGLPALRRRLEAFIDRGFSKLVVVPAVEPDRWADELAEVADQVLPLQDAARVS
jgi:probable F420-dependent oxidoreductase